MKKRQQGATLVVGLVMLVVLTLLVMSAIRSSNINFRIVGNMQAQTEIRAAAQRALEQVLSGNFTLSPTASIVPVDINADGTADYSVDIAVPVCTYSVNINNQDLDPANPLENTCINTAAMGGSLILQSTGKPLPGPSWCYLQHWETRASATDPRTGAGASMYQGVKLKVTAGTAC